MNVTIGEEVKRIMPKTKKRFRDFNQLAGQIVGEAIGDLIEVDSSNNQDVTCGRLGGLKGGKARADKLTPERRKEIAQKAANIRWQGE